MKLIASLVPAALLVCIVYGQSNRPFTTPREISQGQQNEARSNQDESSIRDSVTSDVPSFADESVSNKAQKDGERSAGERDDNSSEKDNSKMLAVIALVIAIASAFAAVVTAYYARKQWQTTEKVAAEQLRAYVGIHGAGIERVADDRDVVVKLTAVNYGQTPAFKFSVRATLGTYPYPLPRSFILPEPPRDETESSVLFPRQPNPAKLMVWKMPVGSLSSEERTTAKHATETLYVHGIATYTDIFGIEHHTEFCYFRIIGDGASEPGWCHVAGHNSAD
jgi:hypothetical protein